MRGEREGNDMQQRMGPVRGETGDSSAQSIYIHMVCAITT